MKRVKRFLIFLLFALFIWQSDVTAEAAVNADGSVDVSEENFPDERFRKLASYLDKDKNNVLSLSERSALKHLKLRYSSYIYTGNQEMTTCVGKRVHSDEVELEWACRDFFKKLSVQGIEYFPELESYFALGYLETEGSLKNNAKLKSITLAEEVYGFANDESFAMADCSKIEQEFPMQHLETIRLGVGFQCQNFSLKSATNLKNLEIGRDEINAGYYGYAYGAQIGKLDLSGNTKLEKLILRDVRVDTVDLRKNKKLKEVRVIGIYVWNDFFSNGDKAGLPYTITDSACKLKLPAKNKIRRLEYTGKTKKLDLTSCKKLTFLRVRGGEQIKFNGNWYKKFGKKKLTLYVRGSKMKKNIKKKTKKYCYVNAKTLKDRSPDWDPDYDLHHIHG